MFIRAAALQTEATLQADMQTHSHTVCKENCDMFAMEGPPFINYIQMR